MITQLVTTPLLAKLRAALSANFPAEKVDEILLHYAALRRFARLDQYEACLVNGGKFVEAVLKCLHYRRTGNEVDALTVSTVIKQLESDASLSDAEKTTIPRTLQAIYEFRNKRGGAHNFSFDPIKMDCAFVVAASNWVMEELIRLYMIYDPGAAQALVENLLVKDLPLIEEIDGDYLVLRPGLSARMELEIILWQHYPNRCLIRDLIQWVHNHSAENIRTTLRNMRQKNLAHENESGWKLTELGVVEAEAEIAKIQVNKGKINTSKVKGARHGKR